MSHTYAQPPGRTRQQRDRKPRQWNSEEQDTIGASARPSGSHSSRYHPAAPLHHPTRRSQVSNPGERSLQHEGESPQQQNPLQWYVKC